MPNEGGREIRDERGTVVLAQEDRFRLQTDDGRSLLFIVGKQASPSVSNLEGLEALAESRRRIRVIYRGEPDAGAVAIQLQAA